MRKSKISRTGAAVLMAGALAVGGCQTSGPGSADGAGNIPESKTMLDVTIAGEPKVIADCLWEKLDFHDMFNHMQLVPKAPSQLADNRYVMKPSQPLRLIYKSRDKSGSVSFDRLRPGQAAPAGADVIELIYEVVTAAAPGNYTQVTFRALGPSEYSRFFTAFKNVTEQSAKACAE